jgi:hypothetical protein
MVSRIDEEQYFDYDDLEISDLIDDLENLEQSESLSGRFLCIYDEHEFFGFDDPEVGELIDDWESFAWDDFLSRD